MGLGAALDVNPSLYPDSSFDVQRDFTPDLPSRRGSISPRRQSGGAGPPVKELIDYARANPGKLKYSSSGVAARSTSRPSSSRRARGVDIVHLPIRAVSGRVDGDSVGEHSSSLPVSGDASLRQSEKLAHWPSRVGADARSPRTPHYR